MKNKKNYDNLFDSICMTILFFVFLAFYLFTLWFGVINPNEGSNPIALLIFSTMLFGVMLTIATFLIVKFCYGYWILSDDSIVCRQLFSKRTEIKIKEIEKVEKKLVSAFVLGIYQSEAYIIYSSDRKIVILIKERKKYPELEYALAGFIKNEQTEG